MEFRLLIKYLILLLIINFEIIAQADTIKNIIHYGNSDGKVFPVIVDKDKLTGLSYEISFDTLDGSIIWNVDRTENDYNRTRILSNQRNLNADDESPIADGIQFKVLDAPFDFKGFDMTSNANGPVTETIGYDITTAPQDRNAYSADWYRDVAIGNASILNLVNGMQAAGGWFFIVAGDNTVSDHSTAVSRFTRSGTNSSLLIQNNYEIRFTQKGGKAWMPFTSENVIDVPFEIWYLGPNLNNPDDDIRMMPWINDDNTNDIFDFHLDHEASSQANDPYSDWIYFMMPEPNAQPGEFAYEASVARTKPPFDNVIEIEHLARIVIMNWNQYQSGGSENSLPEVGTTFRIRMTVPIIPGKDSFKFTALKAVSVKEQNSLPLEYDLYQNYPNPFNPNTTMLFSLPQQDHINIIVYNMTGEIVSIPVNNQLFEAGNHEVQFSGAELSSGIYIIEMKASQFKLQRKMLLLK